MNPDSSSYTCNSKLKEERILNVLSTDILREPSREAVHALSFHREYILDHIGCT